MAFNEQLADRVRAALLDVPDLHERRMFGGLAFLIGRHMACGVIKDALMLRLEEQGADAALDEPHVRAMDFTGKPTMVSSTWPAPQPTARWRAGSGARSHSSRAFRAGRDSVNNLGAG